MWGAGGLGEKGEGIKKYKWTENSHGDVKYSPGNTVDNTVIPMCGAGWELGGGITS